MPAPAPLRIAPAGPGDVGHLIEMIRELAAFEHLSHLVECTEEKLQAALFGPRPCIEALIGWVDDPAPQAVAYTICFQNYSTFLGRPGLYLEDLYVRPDWRHRGHARRMLTHLAALATERGCGRFEWSVLDWNTGAQDFYRRLGAEVLPDWRITRLTGAALQRLAGNRS